MKAQTEILIILAIIVIGVVVAVYILQNMATKPHVALTDKESIENLIKSAALENLRELAFHGGYKNPRGLLVSFSGERIPYWMSDGQINIPDFRRNLENAIKESLKERKDLLKKLIPGAEIEDPQTVSVNIFQNSIEVTVNMPVKVKGKPIKQPFKVKIDSKLGEVLEFSRKFLEFQRDQRPFEKFTLSSIMLSEYDDPTRKVPIHVLLTECGQFVHKTYRQVSAEMEKIIKGVVAQTYLPGKYPEGVLEFTSYPKYSLPELNGKEYSDIEVTFWVPDGFSLNRNTFSFSPEPITARAKIIPYVGECQSEPVYVRYSLNYPVIVRAEDTLTGIPVVFAFNVFIKDNDITPYEEMEQQEQLAHCENPVCLIDITVSDTSGRPIDDAIVAFMGCFIGETENGRLRSQAPCGLGTLEVVKEKYTPYIKTHTPDDLEDLRVTLEKKPFVRLKFWEVNVREESTAEGSVQYRIIPGTGRGSDINPVREGLMVSLITSSPETRRPLDLLVFDSIGGTLDFDTGSYTLQANLVNKDFSILYGSIITSLDITEDMDGKELNIYIPYTITFQQIQSKEELAIKAETLTKFLESCGLGPVRLSEITEFKGCVRTGGELGV